MEKKKNLDLVTTFLITIMLIMSVISTIVTSVTYKSFEYFEIFYLLCLVLGLCIILMSTKIPRHKIGGLILVGIGFLVNSYFWSFRVDGATAQGLNFTMTAMILATVLLFVHTYFFNRGRAFFFIEILMLVVFILTVAIYTLASTNFNALPDGYTTCIVLQNVSLLCTLALPLTMTLAVCRKENKDVKHYIANPVKEY